MIKYFLSHQVKYVLTERFYQNPLESYFGRARSMGRHRVNPNIITFEFQDNTICNSKIFRPIAGNSRKDEEQNFEMQNIYSLVQTKENQKCYSYSGSVAFIFLCLSSYVHAFKLLVDKKQLF